MARFWEPLVYDREAILETRTKIVRGQEVTRTHLRRVPHVGELIVWRDRMPYRVTAVTDIHRANWREETVTVWNREGRPDPGTWPGRERGVHVVPAADPTAREKAKCLYPWVSDRQWWPIREQYPVCVDCGLIWPCPCDERNTEAHAAMREVDRLGSILPGCCWACNEPVTGRHHSILFDGDNLLLPGGSPVVFHTSQSRKAVRGTCRQQAEEYEQRWVKAAPGRKVRLRCEGILYRHIDFSECTAGDACPGDDASHTGHSHCTTAMWGYVMRDAKPVPVEETRPAVNCGTRGCRGPKPPAEPQPAGTRQEGSS